MVLAGRQSVDRRGNTKEDFVSASTVHGKKFDQQSVWRTSKIYCDTCHFGPKARAGLNLEALDLVNLGENGAIWEKVLRKLRSLESLT
jgi:hypothetical protein